MLNLWGDSNEFVTQRNLYCREANVVFLFVHVFNEETYKAAIDGVKESNKIFTFHLSAMVIQSDMKHGTSKTMIPKTRERIDGTELNV